MNVNYLYEFNYEILVAILDFGLLEALLLKPDIDRSYILDPINCDTKSFSAIYDDHRMSLLEQSGHFGFSPLII